MIDEPALVATNESYFSKSTGRTEAILLDDKVIFPNNILNTPSTRQNDTYLYGATKALSFLFGVEIHYFCQKLYS